MVGTPHKSPRASRRSSGPQADFGTAIRRYIQVIRNETKKKKNREKRKRKGPGRVESSLKLRTTTRRKEPLLSNKKTYTPLTLDAGSLRRGGHADRPAAALRAVHGRECLVPLLLIAKPDEAEALGRARHGVGHHLGAENRGILLEEGCFELSIGHFRREVPHENGILGGLLYALSAGSPVQPVAKGGPL